MGSVLTRSHSLVDNSGMGKCNSVVKSAWLGSPNSHVRCPVPGNRQPYMDIATET